MSCTLRNFKPRVHVIITIMTLLNTQTIVTFILFSLEAILHYNIGRNTVGNFRLYMPDLQDSIKIFGVVALFSMLSSVTTKYIEGKQEQEQGKTN